MLKVIDGTSVELFQRKIPWLHIATSWAVWVNLIGQFGAVWGLFTTMVSLNMNRFDLDFM